MIKTHTIRMVCLAVSICHLIACKSYVPLPINSSLQSGATYRLTTSQAKYLLQAKHPVAESSPIPMSDQQGQPITLSRANLIRLEERKANKGATTAVVLGSVAAVVGVVLGGLLIYINSIDSGDW